jgi:hypothetical protein
MSEEVSVVGRMKGVIVPIIVIGQLKSEDQIETAGASSAAQQRRLTSGISA